MSKKKAFIPFAVIISDEIPERFESAYASTLYETIPLLDGCNSDAKNLPGIYYLSRIIRSLNLGKISSKLFVIYNPNSQRLQMALFGDPDKLILQVKRWCMKWRILLSMIRRSIKRMSRLIMIFRRIAHYLIG